MRDEKVTVRKVIENFFRAMDTQDLELMKEIIAHDDNMVHIGTDTDEIWRGWDDLHEATLEQFENLEYYKADIRELSVHLSRSGEVAWYEHLLDAEINSGGRVTEWSGARFTGVLELRNNRWVLVQTHVSLPEGTG